MLDSGAAGIAIRTNRGTLERYRDTLREWNPALGDDRIEALIGRLLGVEIPRDYRIADFDRPAPWSFFEKIVYRESRKMLFRIGGPERISPFVGLEHGGPASKDPSRATCRPCQSALLFSIF